MNSASIDFYVAVAFLFIFFSLPFALRRGCIINSNQFSICHGEYFLFLNPVPGIFCCSFLTFCLFFVCNTFRRLFRFASMYLMRQNGFFLRNNTFRLIWLRSSIPIK